jgi:hypothetical protein
MEKIGRWVVVEKGPRARGGEAHGIGGKETSQEATHLQLGLLVPSETGQQQMILLLLHGSTEPKRNV